MSQAPFSCSCRWRVPIRPASAAGYDGRRFLLSLIAMLVLILALLATPPTANARQLAGKVHRCRRRGAVFFRGFIPGCPFPCQRFAVLLTDVDA